MERFKQLIRKLTKYKYASFMFCFFYLMSFLLRISVMEFNTSAFIFPIINTFILFLILNIFSKIRFKLIAILLFSLLLTFDCVFYFHFGSAINYGIIASIFATDQFEAVSVMKNILPLALLFFALYIFLIIKTVQELKEIKLTKKRSFIFLLIAIFVLPISLMLRFNKETISDSFSQFKQSPTLSLSEIIAVKYPLITGNIFTTLGYLENTYILDKASKVKRSNPSGVTFDETFDAPIKIYFVLGESSLRSHYSLYGYKLKTTPFLDSLARDTSKMFYYQNVISPASYTLESIKRSLTFATPLDSRPAFEEKNILELANSADFETFWLSNQDKNGLMNASTSTISMNAKHHYFEINTKREDLDLIELLRSKMVPQKRQFFVIHLRGSHMSYHDRFDAKDSEALGFKGKTIDYDKSIHHTDRVLKTLYDIVKESEDSSIIYYVPDHGEIVNKGHSILDGSLSQFEIPLIVIKHQSKLNVDGIITKYYNKESGYLNSSSTSHILAEIMGYSVDESRVKKSVDDGRYIIQPNNKTYIYEELVKKQAH